MNDAIQYYKDTRKRLKAYEYMMWLLSWDAETEAPKGSIEYRSKQVEVMTNEMYAIETDPKYVKAIEFLFEHKHELDDVLRIEIEKTNKELRIIKLVPKDEFIDYQVLLSKSVHTWAEAKNSNNFALYQPSLESIVLYQQKLVKYLETDTLKGYDILLDMYEEGFNQKTYDDFFNTLKRDLVPFAKEVSLRNVNIHPVFINERFDAEKQKAFSEYLLDVFHYDRNRGLLKTSEHPFTSGVTSRDTRITTRYLEDQLASSIFSTIHEIGHGLYELGNDEALDDTYLHGGTSLGIHESQSRMYENMIGRSRAFWETHFPKLQDIFTPQLNNVTVNDFITYINDVKASLIRVEADELTYALHIMVRYEIEKGLIDGSILVSELPHIWKTFMKDYLGIEPKDDTTGVLQDIHWSFGAFGYFPTYALGSAYGAQIYDAMSKEINIEKAIRDNKIDLINAWTLKHIHVYGQLKNPQEIMLIATKKAFDPSYYVKYLKQKYAN
jgi:carboxypeptidase Taq